MANPGAGQSGNHDGDAIAASVAQRRHRDVVGGLWDDIGTLQYDFLCSQGLQSSSRLIDIGCGCLRGGTHFVAFLQPGNYYGIDIDQSLLDAGYEIELRMRNLQDRLPRANLIRDDAFRFSRFPVRFEFALAHSVFTHLPLSKLQTCLASLAPSMTPDGVLFATCFIVPDTHPVGAAFDHPDGLRSFDDAAPYHYRPRQLRDACIGLPWSATLLGDWRHPRGQQMVRFGLEPVATHAIAGENLRARDVADALELPAGADHYRAYVGPPDRYDFMSASQFALLFALGLRDTHHVLDFGCGSLRLGRLLIPFLAPERYFGIDPNTWLMNDAIARELGPDSIRIKNPSFASNDDFRCDVFGRTFDTIVAQSVLTHCGVDHAQSLLRQMGAVLARNGRIVFSMMEATADAETPVERGWIYPYCVHYGKAAIVALCEQAGLICRRIPWYHPAATWYVAARSAEHLPPDDQIPLLRGAVLFDPQFKASLSD